MSVCVFVCVCVCVCVLTVTNTGGMQTKSTAIIVLSRGQSRPTMNVDNYTPINMKRQNTTVMSLDSDFSFTKQTLAQVSVLYTFSHCIKHKPVCFSLS